MTYKPQRGLVSSPGLCNKVLRQCSMNMTSRQREAVKHVRDTGEIDVVLANRHEVIYDKKANAFPKDEVS